MPWFSKENFACAILYIIYWFLYDSGGGAFASSQCPHPREFANFIKKMLMPGGNPGGGGGDGHRWNWLMHNLRRRLLQEQVFNW